MNVAKPPHGPLPPTELPAHEILDGEPNAGCLFTAKSSDERTTAGFWSCDVGRYEFFFDYDEFVYLVEGEVRVTDKNDPERSWVMQPGDTAHFENGCTAIWEVTKKMKKYFVATPTG